MMAKKWLTATAACVVVLSLAGSIRADQLVFNGGFETGDFSGWMQSGNLSFTGVGNNATLPPGGHVFDGNFSAFFGPLDLGFISQNLATVPGQEYRLTFWLAHPYTEDPGQGVEWLVRVGGNTLLDAHDSPNFDYRQFLFEFTATSASTELQFGFREPPRWFFLDDVSVESVPEPGSLVLLGAGVFGLVGYGYRRRK